MYQHSPSCHWHLHSPESWLSHSVCVKPDSSQNASPLRVSLASAVNFQVVSLGYASVSTPTLSVFLQIVSQYDDGAGVNVGDIVVGVNVGKLVVGAGVLPR